MASHPYDYLQDPTINQNQHAMRRESSRHGRLPDTGATVTPEQQIQDEGERQRYTYIPSTSSFSPPPATIPGQFPAAFSPHIAPLPGQHAYPFSPYGPVPPVIPPEDSYQDTPIIPPPHMPIQLEHATPYASIHPFRGKKSKVKDSPPITIITAPHMPMQSTEHSAYMSVHPFHKKKSKSRLHQTSLPVIHDDDRFSTHIPVNEEPNYVIYPYAHRRTVFLAMLIDALNWTFQFFFDSLPRQAYLFFLLHLPSLYWSRVARIFEEAEMTMPEIESMALQAMGPITIQQLQWSSPAGANLKATWEAFIDSLLREWKTLNIVSVLLLSAILTILQIEAASADPITRNCALISLICALMSILYGCIYIIRFAGMRKTYKALEWAKMAQKTTTVIWWNVWVLLALPATWLAWSIILYIACIMAFIWRTGSNGLEVQLTLSTRAALAIRIAISAVLGLGVFYFALILNTLRRYGDSMDERFKKDLEALSKANRYARYHEYGPYNPYYPNVNAVGPYAVASQQPPWFRRAKVLDFRFQVRLDRPMPDRLVDRKITHQKWEKFISEAYNAWNGLTSIPFSVGPSGLNKPRPQDIVARLLEKWNQKYFLPRGTMGILCHEYIDLFPDSPAFAIYIIDATPVDNQPMVLAERFGPVPPGLSRIDIFDQPGQDKKSTRRILGRTSIFSTRNPLDRKVRFPSREKTPEPESPPESPTDTYLSTQYSSTPAPFQPTSILPTQIAPSAHPVNTPWQSSVIDENGRFLSPAWYRPYDTRSESPSRSTIATERHPSGPSPASGLAHRPPSPMNSSRYDSQTPVPSGMVPPHPPSINPQGYASTGFYPRYNSKTPEPSGMVPPYPPGVRIPPQGYRSVSPWGVPPGWPPPPSGQDFFNPHIQQNPTTLTRNPRRRRSRTLSPVRSSHIAPNRSIPLPAVSPDYAWSTRPDLGPYTPNPYQTPSAISHLDILVPPPIPNQWPRLMHQYPYVVPPMPRFSDPRANLAEILTDSYPQQIVTPRTAQPQDVQTPSRTPDPGPEEQEPLNGHNDVEVSDLPERIVRPQSVPLPDVTPGASGSSRRSTRRRSSSSSYKSFSQSPPREHRVDPSAPSQTLSSFLRDALNAESSNSHQLGGASSSTTVYRRGRDATPRGERPWAVHQPVDPRTETRRSSSGPALVSSTDVPASHLASQPHSVVNGPWTMDQHSLRTIFDTT